MSVSGVPIPMFNTKIGDQLDNTLEADNDQNWTLFGLGGMDILLGGGGDDYLDGGTEDDVLIGGDGDDTYVVNGNDSVVEGSGSDSGIDTILLGFYPSSGIGSYTMPDNIENLCLQESFTGQTVFGNDLNNEITGNSRSNTIWGREGNDNIKGAQGDDFIYGEDGDDTISGGAGDDIIYGDLIGQGNDNLVGGRGNDFLAGGDGEDTLKGSNFFTTGEDDIDTLSGGYADNTEDRYVLGNNNGVFYSGTGHALILDFEDGIDTIQLKGTMDDYDFSGNTFTGVGDAGIADVAIYLSGTTNAVAYIVDNFGSVNFILDESNFDFV